MESPQLNFDLNVVLSHDTKSIVGAERLVVSDKVWGKNPEEYSLDFTELSQERTIGLANFIAKYRTHTSDTFTKDERSMVDFASELFLSEMTVFEEVNAENGYWSSSCISEVDQAIKTNTGLLLHFLCHQNRDPSDLANVILKDPTSTIRKDHLGNNPLYHLLHKASTDKLPFKDIKPSVYLLLNDFLNNLELILLVY